MTLVDRLLGLCCLSASSFNHRPRKRKQNQTTRTYSAPVNHVPVVYCEPPGRSLMIRVSVPPLPGARDRKNYFLQTDTKAFARQCSSYHAVLRMVIAGMPWTLQLAHHLETGTVASWPAEWRLHVLRVEEVENREFVYKVYDLSLLSRPQFVVMMEEFKYRHYRDILWAAPACNVELTRPKEVFFRVNTVPERI